MTVANLHPMTLAEAQALLASIDYDPNWTIEQLRAAADALPSDVVEWLPVALMISAAAAQAEANALKAELDRRAKTKRN